MHKYKKNRACVNSSRLYRFLQAHFLYSLKPSPQAHSNLYVPTCFFCETSVALSVFSGDSASRTRCSTSRSTSRGSVHTCRCSYDVQPNPVQSTESAKFQPIRILVCKLSAPIWTKEAVSKMNCNVGLVSCFDLKNYSEFGIMYR